MSGTSSFTDSEHRFLVSPPRTLARIATIGSDGTLHVVPSGWSYNEALGTIDATGREVEKTKKFREALIRIHPDRVNSWGLEHII